jgi:hypothetical protein
MNDSFTNINGERVEIRYRWQAVDPDGMVCLFTDKPRIALVAEGNGTNTPDWVCDGYMRWSGQLQLPIDWENTIKGI